MNKICWFDWVGSGWFRWGGWFGMFMMIIFLILIVMGILWFFRFGEIAIRKTTKSKALETLAERYAKGEIDDEEYERRKKKILEDI